MQGIPMQLFMTVVLLLSLFLPDGWVLGNAPQSADKALFAIMVAIFVCFSVEMAILAWVQDGYFPNFYFWLDLVGTISIIFDIGWITDEFIPEGSSVSQTSLVRATRAAKLGARYGRLMRLLRLLRFLKFLPCFKNMSEDEFEPTMSAIKKVSEKLSNLLSARIAMLVLILVIVMPFLSYPVHDYSANAWITNAKMLAKDETTTWFDIQDFGRKCNNFYEPKDYVLRLLKIESPWYPDQYKVKYDTRDVLRTDNIAKYISSYYVENSVLTSSGNAYAVDYVANAAADGRDGRSGYTEFRVALHLDQTVVAQDGALLNILIIIMVLVLLMFFSGSFTGTVNKLVIQPLENMMKTLRGSAMLMIKSLKSLEAASDEKSKKSGDEKSQADGDTDSAEENLETAQLEQMVAKLSRIIENLIPSSKGINTANMDSTTANWLNTQFTNGLGQRALDMRRTDSVLANENDIMKKLAKLEQTISQEMVQELNGWYFDVLKYESAQLHQVILYIFSKLNLLDDFKVPEEVLLRFCNELNTRYINTNTYHNYKHGVDVCFTSFRLMYVPGLNSALSSLEVFSVLVGALAHDVGHPGLNNAYLIKSQHELAVRHNDRSPLENMHCVTLYEVLANPETNILVGLDKKQKAEARGIILTIILGTDMAHHFEQISKTQVGEYSHRTSMCCIIIRFNLNHSGCCCCHCSFSWKSTAQTPRPFAPARRMLSSASAKTRTGCSSWSWCCTARTLATRSSHLPCAPSGLI
ncbi:3',5'-cyclic nucleotide phosphodiesterase [archaeon]|nr:MAG: 3',5'-cyclic nucleotide phosphodiesterase [archaeon]